MARRNRKRQYRRQGKSLISSGKINPHWRLTEQEICQALSALGVKAITLKKVHYLKHQVCISWWDENGDVCSSFFSYRIFGRWQAQVERLIYSCQSLKELYILMGYIQYELDYFPYPVEIADAIALALENCKCQLQLLLLGGWNYCDTDMKLYHKQAIAPQPKLLTS